MSSLFHDNDHRLLAVRLRDEADASRPEFSESLHEFLCRSIGPQETKHVSRLSPRIWRQPWLIMAAAAACFLVGITIAWQSGLVLWHPGDEDPSEVAKDVNEPATESTERHREETHEFEQVAILADTATDRLSTLVQSTIAEQQFAYLDHDARAALEGLVAQLPFDVPPITLAWSDLAGEDEP
jgi:hypothetical protein